MMNSKLLLAKIHSIHCSPTLMDMVNVSDIKDINDLKSYGLENSYLHLFIIFLIVFDLCRFISSLRPALLIAKFCPMVVCVSCSCVEKNENSLCLSSCWCLASNSSFLLCNTVGMAYM